MSWQPIRWISCPKRMRGLYFGRARDGRQLCCGARTTILRPDGSVAVMAWLTTASDARLHTAVEGALGEIDGFATLSTGMALFKFVGKDLFAFAAFGAFADKGFQVLECFIAGTMLGCGHNSLLFWILNG
jgi:hypothetical protein